LARLEFEYLHVANNVRAVTVRQCPGPDPVAIVSSKNIQDFNIIVWPIGYQLSNASGQCLLGFSNLFFIFIRACIFWAIRGVESTI